MEVDHAEGCEGRACYASSVQELTDTTASKHKLKTVLFQRCYSSSTYF